MDTQKTLPESRNLKNKSLNQKKQTGEPISKSLEKFTPNNFKRARKSHHGRNISKTITVKAPFGNENNDIQKLMALDITASRQSIQRSNKDIRGSVNHLKSGASTLREKQCKNSNSTMKISMKVSEEIKKELEQRSQ